jgi:hypothetical protein
VLLIQVQRDWSKRLQVRGARTAPMAVGGGLLILGRRASKMIGERGRTVEEQVGKVLGGAIGRGRPVAGGFG